MSLFRRITRSKSKAAAEAASTSQQPPPPDTSREPSPPPPPRRNRNQPHIMRQYLDARACISTPYIDFGFLDRIGIAEEFLRITTRVGFTKDFWEIPSDYLAFEEPTREFLSTLSLVEIPDKGPGIKFTLCGGEHEISFRRLRKWFHLGKGYNEYLGYIPETEVRDVDPVHESVHRHNLWYYLSDEVLPDVNPDPKIHGIIHPVLRFTCRALGSTIFSRGETTYRPIHGELALLATILRPDDQLRRPDLMLHMVKHWMKVASTRLERGIITMGSYVTHLAHCMDIDLGQYDYHSCAPGIPIDQAKFTHWHWIKVVKRRGQEDVIKWKCTLGGIPAEIQMPIPLPPIDFTQPHTWRIQQGPFPIHPDMHDVHMHDAQEQPEPYMPPPDDDPYAGYQAPPDTQQQIAGMYQMMTDLSTWRGTVDTRLDEIHSMHQQLHERQNDQARHFRRLRRYHIQQGRRLSDVHDMMRRHFHIGGSSSEQQPGDDDDGAGQ